MKLKEFFDGFKEANDIVQNPDFNNMGSWPAAIKMTALLIVSAIIVGAFFWFTVRVSNESYQREVAREPGLKDQYRTKSFQAANLDAFRQQLLEMEETFGALLNQLPDETEMPGLLDDISTTGTQSGLEIDQISPQGESAKEFYIETPISIRVRGSYHEMGNFVSAMAAIPRIVTLHNFEIRAQAQSANENDSEAPLTMTILARTYRYKGDQ